MAGGYRIQLGSSAKSVALSAHDADLRVSFERAGMRVWSNEPILEISEDAWIIGHLFTRGPPSRRVSRIPDAVLDRFRATGGRSLLRDFWGGYLLIQADGEGRAMILRDPSGARPCYYRRDSDGVTLASDITALASPANDRADLDEIGRLLAGIDAPTRRTCVTGIEELVAGECLIVADGKVTIESWWSPWSHVAPNGMDFADNAARLRDTICDCVAAWVDCFPRALLDISGGLDSSIVAAAAAPLSSKITCLTHVGPDRDGDERHYARAVTESLGLTLHECSLALDDIDIDQAPASHHPWPNAYHFKQAIAAMHSRFRTANAVGAHFSGNGGDGIFCSLYSPTPLLDRVIAEGPRLALAATLRDLSGVTGADIPTILRYAWNKYRRDGGRHNVRHNTSGLRSHFVARMERSDKRHPWLVAPEESLPGKTSHVAFLMRAHRSLELYPRAEAPPHIAPLLSQPVVELCLSIPTWMWITNGINRSVARSAFSDRLPPMIATRVHKGGPSGFSFAIYRANRERIHALLRNGHLAAEGIIDTKLLDEPDDPSWRGAERIQRLLEFAAAESWARHWNDS
ncbi:asparagine synthase-related protein [Sphingopyxis sp. GW247-27LB]|jgi:asparagine synthase (glutamine-hydrolysing)|uniref:asparagine synthase-related protein n=1 Tax=Sphingopyxis sp. GW247-27LB TaxID=2012632 RepID=UPI000BA77E24|nr:asparagine synthase-related protein [Sphingopyxis sp. GW247-27LB]PAL24285.1 hypothetical protein CD928_05175 [Sphingopyxis sp. GW247-27LB]